MRIFQRPAPFRALLLALLLLGALLGLHGCSGLAGSVANAVYPALDEPWDPENAPTVLAVPASADIRAVIGGRGRGLNCSIPGAVEGLIFGGTQDKTPVSLQFRQACVFHDYCYRHGHATYGYQKLDCDALLQQHAYRLCRRIYTDSLSVADCRERARVVLLGVNAFGGDNFQHGHRSTYFEFDPFPQRAGDYVAARLVRHREVPGEVVRPDSRQRASSLWVFSIKDGWMTIRDRRFESSIPSPDRQAPVTPFLLEKVTLPPHVLRSTEGDRFVWLGRRSLANTGIYALAIDATSGVQVARSLAAQAPHRAQENTGCRVRAKPGSAQGEAPRSALEFDCDTGLVRPVALECGGGKWRVAVLAAWGSGASTQSDPCAADDGLSVLHHGYRGSVLHDRYRLAQDQFVTGRFGQGGGAELVTLAHGLVPGGDYRASAMAFRVAATRPGAAESIPIAISEEVQPVAPFRVAGEGHDRLLALQAECGDEACSARAIDWKLPLSWGSQVALTGEALSLGVGSDWMRQPAQVVEPAVQGEGDWLVLTRVKDGGAPGMDEASYVPATVRLEYKAFKRAAGGWEARGGACVSVDISAQVRANLRAALANRYFPSTGDTRSVEKAKAQTEACAKSGGDEARANPACLAMLRDFASRWHRSQVIPGYMARRPAERQAGRVPEAEFVFNGFTGYTLTLGADAHGPAWAHPCASGG